MRKSLLLFLFLVLLSPSLLVQENLKGKVTCSLNNSPLTGANDYLSRIVLGSTVNIVGTYSTIGIPTGTYNAKFSYIYNISKEFTRIITDNRTFEQDVIQYQEAIITAKALGHDATIDQQLSSNTIVDLFSEQKIQEFPDANAADAIGRLPEVSKKRSGRGANKIVLRC